MGVNKTPQTIIDQVNSIIINSEQININRVMINKNYAITGKEMEDEARINEAPGYKITVIFIRYDGWTLASNAKFSKYAERLWSKEWIGMVRLGFPRVIKLNTDGQYWRNITI